jgi:hypothetical protein
MHGRGDFLNGGLLAWLHVLPTVERGLRAGGVILFLIVELIKVLITVDCEYQELLFWGMVEQMLSQQKRDYSILHPEQVRQTHSLVYIMLIAC